MMYKDKLLVVVKNNGKIMREHRDQILLPFGSEYSLSLKNLDSRTAVAKIQIDGTDVLKGHQLILKSGIEFPLERFFNGNLNNGNRFKFIEKTKEISDFRGDKIDDGLIRIEFWFEKPIEYYFDNTFEYYFDNTFDYSNFSEYSAPYIPNMHKLEKIKCRKSPGYTYKSSGISSKLYDNSINYSCAVDDGITVKGSELNQSFAYGSVGILEDLSHVMVLKLNGYNQKNVKIVKPITITTKLQCETCGRRWKSNIKYCPNCGTYLL